MRMTPAKLAAALICAAGLGAFGAKQLPPSAPAPQAMAKSASGDAGMAPDMTVHGFELAAGSDPALMKVSDAGGAGPKIGANAVSLAARGGSIADVVESSAPSVVQVRVQKRADAGESEEQDEEGSLLDFLRRFGAPGMPPPGAAPKPAPKGSEPLDIDPKEPLGQAPRLNKPEGKPETAPKIPFPKPPAKPPLSGGVGSGFFIDKEGHILTNAHVVEGADKIIIRLSDKREIGAKLVGMDKRTDIALLIADKSELGYKPLPVGSPDKLRVGDLVIAIGSPFGLEFTATAGILSARGRSLPSEDNNYLPFLQTDAAVNPGNSGGPLINERGQVIGINSQIYSKSGGFMGISFAIPIDYAVKIAGKLLKTGSVEHGRIGAYVQEMTPELAQAFGLPGKTGAIVLSVEPSSASEKAGIKASDIVVSIDGKAISGSNEMVRLIADNEPGDTLTFGLVRKGQPLNLPVVLGGKAAEPKAESKKEEKIDEPKPRKNASPANEPMGIRARPLTDKESKAAKISKGLKVLEASGVAESAGIDAGDLIVSVEGQSIGAVSEIVKIVAEAPVGKPLAVLVKREAVSRFVAIIP